MKTISFEVPIDPFGKGRPRFSTKDGCYRTYTPSKTRKNETTIKQFAKLAMGGCKPIANAVHLKATFNFPIPKSYTKKRRQDCLKGKEHPTKKPDIDNVTKGILDPLNGVVFDDDVQVVSMEILKKYVDGDGSIQVEIKELQ